MTLPDERALLSSLIETERLALRSFEPGDWRALLAYMADPAVLCYWPEDPYDEATAQRFVAEHSVPPQRPHLPERLAVITRANQRLIGHMVFHSFHGVHRTSEIGWILHPAAQRQGYATEAARAILAYGFEVLHLHRVVATCDPRNIASYRVMEKLGMRREGYFRKCIHQGGEEWADEYVYAILAEEWASPR